jgi:hypothetical protein
MRPSGVDFSALETAKDAEVRKIVDDLLLRAVDNTIRFMRMAAIQLRHIAEREPELADELRRIAQKLNDDADELEAQARKPRP